MTSNMKDAFSAVGVSGKNLPITEKVWRIVRDHPGLNAAAYTSKIPPLTRQACATALGELKARGLVRVEGKRMQVPVHNGRAVEGAASTFFVNRTISHFYVISKEEFPVDLPPRKKTNKATKIQAIAKEPGPVRVIVPAAVQVPESLQGLAQNALSQGSSARQQPVALATTLAIDVPSAAAVVTALHPEAQEFTLTERVKQKIDQMSFVEALEYLRQLKATVARAFN